MKYHRLPKIVRMIWEVVGNLIAGTRNLIFRACYIPLKPKMLVYMVTDRCNSRCRHCDIWQKKPTSNPLTAPELHEVLSSKLFRDVKYILCTGGEPTTRDDLKEIVLAIHNALPKATIQLSTNALLPDRVIKVVNEAMKHGISFDVGVSIDGIGEDHDRLRGVKGNFAKADSLLRELVGVRDKYRELLHISAGVVVSNFTLPLLESVRAYAKGLKIDLVEAWYNESRFYNNIGKYRLKGPIAEAVEAQSPSPLREKWLNALNGKPLKFKCFAMHTFCVLKCNGDIVPCLNLWGESAGNVRESSPVRIWNGASAKRLRRTIKSCAGCLNSWGAGHSLTSNYYPVVWFYLRNPKLMIRKLGSKYKQQ